MGDIDKTSTEIVLASDYALNKIFSAFEGGDAVRWLERIGGRLGKTPNPDIDYPPAKLNKEKKMEEETKRLEDSLRYEWDWAKGNLEQETQRNNAELINWFQGYMMALLRIASNINVEL